MKIWNVSNRAYSTAGLSKTNRFVEAVDFIRTRVCVCVCLILLPVLFNRLTPKTLDGDVPVERASNVPLYSCVDSPMQTTLERFLESSLYSNKMFRESKYTRAVKYTA